MIGVRVGTGPQVLEVYEYQCQRCGIRRTFKTGRSRPTLCQDCRYVLDYRAEREPEQWTPEDMRAAHSAYVSGRRDEWARSGQLAYDRERARRRRAAMTPDERAADVARLRESAAPRTVKDCPHCGRSVVSSNLPRHIRTAHPMQDPTQGGTR